MSILAKCNFTTSEWEFDVEPESNYPMLQIGFEPKDFNNLSFGYALLLENKVISQKAFPKPGVKYIKTDLDYIFGDRLNLKPDDEATIAFWAENNNQVYQDSITFIVPRPEKPYESWVWNDNGYWDAPIPIPDESNKFAYEWNEEEQSWELHENENELAE